MKISRRLLIQSSLAAAVAIPALFGGTIAQAETLPVRVGYIADYFGASLTAIANDQKLWEKHGLEPELKIFTNGPIQIQALGAGSLDFGYIGPGALWLPASGKAKIVAMNTIGLADRIIAQPGIATMADLKGKKIGVPEGTSGDMLLRLALEKAGMTLSDVQVIKMDPPTVVSAFASRQIDGAGIWYPFVGVIKKTLPNLVEVAKSGDFYPANTFPSAFVARNDVAEQNPEATKRFIAVLKEANDFRAADVARSVTITAKFLGVPAEPLVAESQNGKFLTSAEFEAATRDGTIDGWLKSLSAQFVSFGKLQSPLDPKDYYLGNLYTGG